VGVNAGRRGRPRPSLRSERATFVPPNARSGLWLAADTGRSPTTFAHRPQFLTVCSALAACEALAEEISIFSRVHHALRLGLRDMPSRPQRASGSHHGPRCVSRAVARIFRKNPGFLDGLQRHSVLFLVTDHVDPTCDTLCWSCGCYVKFEERPFSRRASRRHNRDWNSGSSLAPSGD